jgi:ATP-dependent DNA helicase RecG
VGFAKLGLAIVDEQHRFGVEQRLALSGKAAAGPEAHQLMMSATPIPRTLSMSYYADLDVTVIDELPPGRTPVATRLVAEERRDEVILRVREACAEGAQAYWVCPLIEESEALQLKTAIDTFETIRDTFPDLKVGLVHGRLKPAEKAHVMAEFKAKRIQLLVATTVIEVGVDVPNASLMVIENAERMGLAQLHQLRGRVGRGTRESVAILLYYQPLSELARERLKAIYETTDGFEIARRDLAMRGPGEYLGARQSGAPLLRFADLERDLDLVEQAREVAERLLKARSPAATRHLDRWLGSKQFFLRA